MSALLTGTAGQEPGKVEPLRIVTQSSTSLKFEWDPSLIVKAGLGLTGYQVSYDEGDYVFDTTASLGATATSNTYTVTQPGNEGKTFRFRVAAINELGTGVDSDEIQLVATDPPSTPTLSLLENTRTLAGV